MQTAQHTISAVEQLSQFVRQHPKLFILTGAGISTDSGIPDYRDRDGAWKHSQPIQYQEFINNAYARQRYWARSMIGWPRFASAKANPAHLALARLERLGYVHQLVTQNVDGLHQQAGSRRVIDLHGRLDRIDCLECGHRLGRRELQQNLLVDNPEFGALRAASAPDGDAVLQDIAFERFRLPACPRCAGMVKPAVVFFGESVPRARVDLALKMLSESDALLVIGSSLMVFSGYRFCRAALEQGKTIAALNLGRTRADADLTLKINQPCGAVLPVLAGCLSEC